MHDRTQLPPMQAIARLVCLYRTAGLTRRDWAAYQVPQGRLIELIQTHMSAFHAALDLSRKANEHMGAPIPPSGAFAFLLLARKTPNATVGRFFTGADTHVESDDPRECLRRTLRLHAGSQEMHPDYETLAYLIKGWNAWVNGSKRSRLEWRPDEGMPRIAQWIVDIPDVYE